MKGTRNPSLKGFLKEGEIVRNNASICKEERDSAGRAFCTEIITMEKIKQMKTF